MNRDDCDCRGGVVEQIGSCLARLFPGRVHEEHDRNTGSHTFTIDERLLQVPPTEPRLLHYQVVVPFEFREDARDAPSQALANILKGDTLVDALRKHTRVLITTKGLQALS